MVNLGIRIGSAKMLQAKQNSEQIPCHRYLVFVVVFGYYTCVGTVQK
jgi:hypothetical protein